MNPLLVRRIHPDAILPTRAHPDDAGLDLYTYRDFYLVGGATLQIPLGIQVDIPPGYVGLIHPRSSMGLREIIIPNAPGTIDAGYRGEVAVLLAYIGYLDRKVIEFQAGDRIAQLVIQRVELPQVMEVDHFPDTTIRGSGGFGSTGA